MGKIILMVGPAACGKSTLFKIITEKIDIPLKKIITHTTRPIRDGEQDGREYYFCTEKEMEKMFNNGEILERRSYGTTKGLWYYFTSNKIFKDLNDNYIGINTLKGLERYLRYFDNEDIISLYVKTSDGIRLQRALDKEGKKIVPQYQEMCRRYLSDCEDFSYELIEKLPITSVIDNNGSIEDSVSQIQKVLEKRL